MIMPSIRVLGNPFPEDFKLELAKQMSVDLKRILRVPHCDVFYQEFDEIYTNVREFKIRRVNDEDGSATLLINGPPRDEEVLQELCETLTSDFRNLINYPKFDVIMVYHIVESHCIGTNGRIHSLRGKRR